MRAAAALTATAGAGLGTPGVARTLVEHCQTANAFERDASHTEPFWGAHQGGIMTPPQSHTYLAALDLDTEKRDEVMRLLRAWTAAAVRMTRGEPAPRTEWDAATVLPDSGEAHGLPPARLTLTFGFGTGLFLKEGKDRNGLAARYPGLFLIPRARAREDRQLNNFNLLPAGGQANRLFPAAKAGSESPFSRQFPAAKRPPEAHSWRASR